LAVTPATVRPATHVYTLLGGFNMNKRGFASMDRAKQREIASRGGKAAHKKGTAHEWTVDEAKAAGRKGGVANHRRSESHPKAISERHIEPQGESRDRSEGS
jgi:general stress protein YciG